MRWTLPNLLTLIRLAAAPGVAVVFLCLPRPWADWVAFALFVGAALTDWVDGYLARSLRQESAFGAMLDPIADKAMVVISLAVLLGASGLNAWLLLPAIAILLREVFISGLREFLGERRNALKVTELARWKTFAQMLAIALLFAGMALGESGKAATTAGLALLWAAALLTIVTGFEYWRKAKALIEKEEEG